MIKRIMTFILAAVVLSAVFALTAQAQTSIGTSGIPLTGDDNTVTYIVIALMAVSIVGIGLVIYSFVAGKRNKH